MAINENWNIRSRAHACAHSGVPFEDGQVLVTVLLEDEKTGELLRKDFSLASWKEVESTLTTPFSFWRTEFTVNKSEGNARAEIAEKETAETLLRRLVAEDSITTENTRYILAVMLERKKQLKQTGTRETADATVLVYEHSKSGEIYLIRDPELRLDQIEEVQKEVSRLLSSNSAPEASGHNPAEAPAPPPAETSGPPDTGDQPADKDGATA